MPNFKEKPCKDCGNLFMPTGRRSKFCPACADMNKKARQCEAQMRYRQRNGHVTGVGKGGNAARYKEDSQYKNGAGNFHRLRKKIRDEIRHCEWCCKDLDTATRYEWCVHHIDHDRTHNDRSNMVMICKSCHQFEHGAADHLNS